MEWENLYEMDAAFKPVVNGELDTQNFMKFDEVTKTTISRFIKLSFYLSLAASQSSSGSFLGGLSKTNKNWIGTVMEGYHSSKENLICLFRVSCSLLINLSTGPLYFA